jgi:hypothetical protein
VFLIAWLRSPCHAKTLMLPIIQAFQNKLDNGHKTESYIVGIMPLFNLKFLSKVVKETRKSTFCGALVLKLIIDIILLI